MQTLAAVLAAVHTMGLRVDRVAMAEQEVVRADAACPGSRDSSGTAVAVYADFPSGSPQVVSGERHKGSNQSSPRAYLARPH